jgi:phage terminase small subunit
MSEVLGGRQQQFIAHYLLTLNATKAALAAGYSRRTAYSQGARLLKNVQIARAIASGQQRQMDTAELSATRVLEELRRVALEDRTPIMACRTVAQLQALPAELRALVIDFEVLQANIPGLRDGKTDTIRRVRTASKTAGLEMLAKHFKLLTEVSELQASDELLARLDRGRERNAARGRKK